MIFRVFFALLALNLALFWSQAHADEPKGVVAMESMTAEFQVRQANDLDTEDALATLGTRLLKWQLFEQKEARYASERIRPDHSISVLEEGVALNLAWNF
ncbi:hypothetical protein QQM79_16485 [Marinobacteraceae bacterium S3BR75-40.1]